MTRSRAIHIFLYKTIKLVFTARDLYRIYKVTVQIVYLDTHLPSPYKKMLPGATNYNSIEYWGRMIN